MYVVVCGDAQELFYRLEIRDCSIASCCRRAF